MINKWNGMEWDGMGWDGDIKSYFYEFNDLTIF